MMGNMTPQDFFNMKSFFEQFNHFTKNINRVVEVGQTVDVVDAAGQKLDSGKVISIDDDLCQVEVTKVITVRRSDIR